MAGFAVFLVGTAVLAMIDARTIRLPNRLLHPVAWTGLALLACAAACSGSWYRLTFALASAGALLGAFFLLHKMSGLGRGDVRLVGLLGLFLGWVGPATVFAGVALGTVAGGVFGAVLLLAHKADRRRMLPYGPFLVLGAWLALLLAALP
ncbi:prepilin peptidase [Actinospica robiniae]|uniref:prepilin peptidase n=1 Tax=Actinospica robiniae TaxID=304901 RepID=UPI0012F831E7|nr:prepilin peptidase [Actinospica robiniae]